MRSGLAVVKSLGNHSQGERLYLGLGFVPSGPIGEYTRKVWDLANPSSVFLSLELDLKRHVVSCRSDSTGFLRPTEVHRTLRISCEAVPRPSSRRGPQGGTSACSTGAALSFVSCIALFGGAVHSFRRLTLRIVWLSGSRRAVPESCAPSTTRRQTSRTLGELNSAFQQPSALA